jgi:hypothetical protein
VRTCTGACARQTIGLPGLARGGRCGVHAVV